MIVTKVGNWSDPSWVEEYEWGCTNVQHVWHNATLDLYHFSDEASQLDIIGYQEIEECEEALDLYATNL